MFFLAFARTVELLWGFFLVLVRELKLNMVFILFWVFFCWMRIRKKMDGEMPEAF
jgi:hypothetical protein